MTRGQWHDIIDIGAVVVVVAIIALAAFGGC